MKRITLKSLALLVLVVVLVTSVAACAKSAEPTPTTPTPTTSPTSTPTAEPTTPAMQPKYGGVILVPTRLVAAGFDAHMRTSYSPYYSVPVFNNLVRFDPTISDIGPDTIIGDLAESWDTSADGLTITFKLYQGVKWHDGKPFTADDVVYSIEKMVDSERSRIASNFPGFGSVSKTDDYTVVVKLSKAQPSFVAQLASGYAAIHPKHTAGSDVKSTDFLMGTGPFMYKSRVSDVEFVFEKNPNYFRKDADGNQLPYLDGIKYVIMKDRSAQIDALTSNRLDMTDPNFGATTKEQVDRLDAIKGVTSVWKPSQAPAGSFINTNEGPLADVRVRQAMLMVAELDLVTLAGFGDTMFRSDSHGHIMPRAWTVTNEEANAILGWDKPMDQRIADAKKLMADAGYPDGFELTYVIQTLTEVVGQTQGLADMWKDRLGIDVIIKSLPTPEMNKLRDARDFDIVAQTMFVMVGDPDELASFFTTGSSSNFADYSNPRVDELLAAQSIEPDPAKRRAMVNEVEKTLLADAPFIPTGYNAYAVGWYDYVHGFMPLYSTYASQLAYEQVWLDK